MVEAWELGINQMGIAGGILSAVFGGRYKAATPWRLCRSLGGPTPDPRCREGFPIGEKNGACMRVV